MLGSISRREVIASLIVLATVLSSTRSHAAVESRDILKTYFETGDVPTEQQFSSLIDSLVHYSDDRAILGLRDYNPALVYLPGDTAIMGRFGVGDTTPQSPLGYIDPHINPPLLAPQFTGKLGFLALTLQDSGGTYYGYLQILMQNSTTIEVQYLVFESTPNTQFQMFLVPEPSTLALLVPCASLVMRRRRARTIV